MASLMSLCGGCRSAPVNSRAEKRAYSRFADRKVSSRYFECLMLSDDAAVSYLSQWGGKSLPHSSGGVVAGMASLQR